LVMVSWRVTARLEVGFDRFLMTPHCGVLYRFLQTESPFPGLVRWFETFLGRSCPRIPASLTSKAKRGSLPVAAAKARFRVDCESSDANLQESL